MTFSIAAGAGHSCRNLLVTVCLEDPPGGLFATTVYFLFVHTNGYRYLALPATVHVVMSPRSLPHASLPLRRLVPRTNRNGTIVGDQVQTLLQGVHLREETENLPVSVSRQKSAFPPNFVHSLDSTHMLLTAIEMDKARVPFAAVHDSYWVHAGNVDEMNRHLRQVSNFGVYEVRWYVFRAILF